MTSFIRIGWKPKKLWPKISRVTQLGRSVRWREQLAGKTFPKTEIATVSSPAIDTSSSTAVATFGNEHSRPASPGIAV
ncbi:unnamed protein product [Meloidogyne enterolobii]|uniref:Uncharacterized protein n=1 Tax=Meloidogyne enterolobii TaxID=390850 RepID=A0ACB0ZQM3_MELEN